MTVELGAGKQANIKVYENDDPYELANQFCKTIGLEQEAVELLAHNIIQNIKDVKSQQKNRSQMTDKSENDIDLYQNKSKNSRFETKNEEQDLRKSQTSYLKQSQVSQSQSQKDIFDRLYSESKIKQQNIKLRTEFNLKTIFDQQKSQVPHEKRKINDQEVSICEYLYQQGQREKVQKDRLVELIKLEEQKVKAIEYTYSPKMTINSQIKLKKVGYNTDKLKFEDHMKRLTQIQNEKKEIKLIQHVQQQQNECPFRPQMNKISEQIIYEKEMMNSQQNQTKWDKLHEDAIRINIRKNDPDLEIYDKNVYPFQPSITVTEGSINSRPFIERMQEDVNRKHNLSRTESHASTHVKVDFRPVTGRSPKFNRNSEKLPIGTYLYNQNSKIQHYYFSEKLKQEQNRQKIKPNNKSNLLVQTNYIKKLKEIFDILDSDGDGLISAKNINLQSLSADILETFSSILCNMEIDNRSLNIYQFIEQCIILIQNLNIPQRDKIFNNFSQNKWAKEHELEKQRFNFTPIIDDRSKKLAEKKKDCKFKSKEIVKTSDRQVEKQLKECSFKPKLYRPLNIYEFTKLNKSQTFA